MKVCTHCKQKKNLEEFSFKNKRTGKRSPHCKVCSRLLIREHYNKNKTYYLNKAHSRNRVIRNMNKKYIWSYLASHPCVDCGESDPIVLEFDHIETKLKAVARLVHDNNLDLIKKEIKKCEVRCANCHRRRTALKAGWKKHMPL